MKLDAIREAANANYAHFPIEFEDHDTVFLLNPLQLSAEKRSAMTELQGAMGEDDDDVFSALSKIIRIIANTEEGAEHLLSVVGDNLALLVQIFSEYNKGTEAGEA